MARIASLETLGSPFKDDGGTDTNRFFSGISYRDPDRKVEVFLPGVIIPTYRVSHRMGFTQFPISTRAIVTDHAIREPKVFECTLNVTTTPIDTNVKNFEYRELKVDVRASEFKAGGFLALTNAVGAIASSVLGFAGPKPLSVVTLQGPNGDLQDKPNKFQDAINLFYEELLAVWEGALVCTFYVNGRKYSNMVINSFESVREGAAELGVFNITATEIIFATTGTSSLTLPNPADGRSGEVAQAGSKVPDEKDPRLKSVGATLSDASGLSTTLGLPPP